VIFYQSLLKRIKLSDQMEKDFFEKMTEKFLPKSLSEKLNVERYSYLQLIKLAQERTKKNSILVDAGAGPCMYKPYFSHTNYIAIDRGTVKERRGIDIKGDVLKIPLKNNSVDSIICMAVIEHVINPEELLKEFYRVLKPRGQLFFTAPQGWQQHDKPYDFFRFTSFALEYLAKKSGFRIIFIKPRGGYFWYIGKRLRTGLKFFKKGWLKIFYIPFGIIFGVITPIICYYLDFLDEDKDLTLGYDCYCKK